MSKESETRDSESWNYERQRRNERWNDDRFNSSKSRQNQWDDLRSPLRARPYGSNGFHQPSTPGSRERGNYYKSSRRCQYKKQERYFDTQSVSAVEWNMHSDDFPVLAEKKYVEQSPEISKPAKKNWCDMVDEEEEEEENEFLQVTAFTPEQAKNESPKGILTPDSTPKSGSKSWAKIVRGTIDTEEDDSQICNGIKRRLDLSSRASTSSSENRENLKKPKKKLEHEIDPQVLARRQKQIDYGKNTGSYIQYLKSVPRAMRTITDPNTPQKQWKYSRRSWDSQIKIWKQRLHIWNPANKGGNKTCSGVDFFDLLMDSSVELDLDFGFEICTTPSLFEGSLTDLRSNSSASGDIENKEAPSTNEFVVAT